MIRRPPRSTLFSLHDALPIFERGLQLVGLDEIDRIVGRRRRRGADEHDGGDRKSTPLNSSPSQKSYAVFCFKKKKLLQILVLQPPYQWSPVLPIPFVPS